MCLSATVQYAQTYLWVANGWKLNEVSADSQLSNLCWMWVTWLHSQKRSESSINRKHQTLRIHSWANSPRMYCSMKASWIGHYLPISRSDSQKILPWWQCSANMPIKFYSWVQYALFVSDHVAKCCLCTRNTGRRRMGQRENENRNFRTMSYRWMTRWRGIPQSFRQGI